MRCSQWVLLLAMLWLTLCSACRPSPVCEDTAGCARIPPGQPIILGLALPSDAAECPAREELHHAAVLALLDHSDLPERPTRLVVADVAPAIGKDTLADLLSVPTLAGMLIPECGSMAEAARKAAQDAAVPALFTRMPAGQVNALAMALENNHPNLNWRVVASEADEYFAHALCALRGGQSCSIFTPDNDPIDPAVDLLVVIRPASAPWRLAFSLPEGTQLIVWDDQSLKPYVPPMANTPAWSLILQPDGWPDFAARYYRQFGKMPTSPLAFGVYQDTTRLLDLLAAYPKASGVDWLIPRLQFARLLETLPPWNPSWDAYMLLTLNGQLFHRDN